VDLILIFAVLKWWLVQRRETEGSFVFNNIEVNNCVCRFVTTACTVGLVLSDAVQVGQFIVNIYLSENVYFSLLV